MNYQGPALIALALITLASPPRAQAQGLDFLSKIGSDIDIAGLQQDWDPETQIATVTGEVRIAYDNVVIKANRAEYHTLTGEIKASDQVTVYQDGQIYKGDNVVYNTKAGTISSDGLRSRSGAVLFRAENFRSKTKGIEKIEGSQTFFTTHDSQDPNFHIKSEGIEIYPDDKIVFKKPTIFAGETPVFWLPKLSQPLDDELGYFFIPGYNSRWGAFLLNRYGVMYGDHTLGQYHLDVRSGRGVGVGVDYTSEKFRDNPNIGQLKLYYTYDIDTEYDQSSKARAALSENRYRINFQHRIYLPGPDESTFYLDFDINKLSDRFLYGDFFFSDSIFDPQPDNLINLVKQGENYEMNLLGRFQLNDFFTRDVRSPELSIDVATTPILDSGFFYRGTTSYGILTNELSEQEKGARQVQIGSTRREVLSNILLGEPTRPLPTLFRRINQLQAQIDGTSFNRFYSYHEALYPIALGHLRIVPRAGAGIVDYSSVEGGFVGDSLQRDFYHIGTDISTKWTKEFADIQSRKLGLDRVRHIVQPYVNYSYVNADTPLRAFVDPIDANYPTTKLRPIDIPLFSNIDSITNWNIVRAGVRNTIQTKRGDHITHNWLSWNTFFDTYLEDPEFNRDISGIHNNVEWRPLPWVTLRVDSQFPIDDNPANFSEFNTRVIWSPNDRVNLSLSHLMLQDHPVFLDSSLVTLTSYLRISENWGFGTTHRYEADDSTLEMQSYTLHRDLTSWTASLGAMQIKNEGQDDQVGVILSFTLKDFPSVYLPLDLNPNPTYR